MYEIVIKLYNKADLFEEYSAYFKLEKMPKNTKKKSLHKLVKLKIWRT